ncbi:MAG: hypothetical protein E2O46_05020 [Ignavibacteria bacterium]|nr:MAG: hypothetical protein E2O46_05020 [Ignavibacteria bacterium]
MNEIILNIYLIINNGLVDEFRAVAYEKEGGDDNKIIFLKSRAKEDFNKAYKFDAPTDEKGQFMNYKRFHKFEKRGMHIQLFEEIFSKFNVPDKPLICVTPVVDGEIYSS